MAEQEGPGTGGGWPLIDGWARATLAPRGPRLWQTLNHKGACLSCAWGTGGQNGGFRDELGEPLQRCLKSVEAIGAELQPGAVAALSSAECDRLGRGAGHHGRSVRAASSGAAGLLHLGPLLQ